MDKEFILCCILEISSSILPLTFWLRIKLFVQFFFLFFSLHISMHCKKKYIFSFHAKYITSFSVLSRLSSCTIIIHTHSLALTHIHSNAHKHLYKMTFRYFPLESKSNYTYIMFVSFCRSLHTVFHAIYIHTYIHTYVHAYIQTNTSTHGAQ